MITGVQLAFENQDLIDKLAAVTLKDPVLYEKRVPKKGGPHDSHLGPLDRGTLCTTCYKRLEECQGHSGTLQLPPEGWPVYHPLAMEYAKKAMECLCFYCRRLLIPPGSLRREYITRTYTGKTLLWEMAKACSEMTYCGCPPKDLKFLKSVAGRKKETGKREKRTFDPQVSCGRRKPVFRSKKNADVAISAWFNLDKDQEAPRFNPAVVYNILASISRQDAEDMGFHPDTSPVKSLMTWSIPIATTHVRFPTGFDKAGEDDITIKYNSMLKTRNKLAAALKRETNPNKSFHVTYSWEGLPGMHCKCDGRYLWKETECTCKQPSPNCPCLTKTISIAHHHGSSSSSHHGNGHGSSSSSSSTTTTTTSTTNHTNRDGMIANAIQYKKKEKKDKTSVELWSDLQSEYIALATGEYRGASRGGAPSASFGPRGIKARVIGKGGLVRGAMAGKRQDNSARTVICGSMDIDIDQVGVPHHFCSILTKEEIVTNVNRHYLTDLLRKGEVNRIRNASETVEWSVSHVNKDSMTLEIGDRVDRWLQNGDYVQIGRQPSLHKPSTMAHRVKRLPPGILTFLINLAVTPPYNADHDGDEMWLVVLQSYAAVMDVRLLMHVPFQILSPQNARALIGFVYHNVLAAYHIGFRHVLFEKEQFCQLLQGYIPSRFPRAALRISNKAEKWTGKQLFSCLLPSDLNFESSSGYKKIVIRQGCWLTGYWTKNALSQLVLYLVRDYGYYKTARFISAMQRLFKLFLDDYGATLGPFDLLNPAKDTTRSVLQHLSEASHIRDAKECISQHLLNNSESISRLVHIIRSGTKGSSTNIMQLMSCLGETVLLGTTIRLPTSHFHQDESESLAAKGFIHSSFSTGLKPYESFCHFASGREGLLDTSSKTGRVGYLQRKMARMLGDLRVETDGTVRDAETRIVMHKYGGDGFQPSCVEKTRIRFACIKSVSDFEAQYRHPALDREWHVYLLPLFSQKQKQESITSPIPFERLFDLIRLEKKETQELPWNAQVLFANVERLFHRITRQCPEAFWDRFAVRKWPCMPTASQFKRMEDLVVNKYLPQGLVWSGEMVGPVGGQSILEPAMQMTMRTFYLPGVGSINLQGGLEELNDICNATQGSAAASISMYLKSQYVSQATQIAARIPGRFIKDVCSRATVESRSTSPVRCPCMNTTQDLLCQNPGYIRAADYFLEFEAKCIINPSVLVKALYKYFGSTLANILECNEHVRVYLDRFHPLLVGKDANSKLTLDIILKDAREKLCVTGLAKIKGQHIVGPDSILLIGTGTEAVWSMPEVDIRRTLPSDIREIETLFGIDAAALILEDKLMACMQKQNVPLDFRHASLLAANMTRSGRIVPNTGLGVATESKSALRKCTFEKMSSQLASEAAFGSFDPVKGTVEALILSTVPRMGSNYCHVIPSSSSLSSSSSSSSSIPRTYAELRDLETVAPSYEFVKRFMPCRQTLDSSYVPSNYQFCGLQESLVPPTVSFTIDPVVPDWIRVI